MNSPILAQVFDNLTSGVLLVEKATGHIVEVNRAFLRMCSRSYAEVIGRNFWAPPFVDDAEVGPEVFAHLRTGGQLEDVELPVRAGDGSCLLLELTSAALSDGLVQIEARDITRRASQRVSARMESQRTLAARVCDEFAELHIALKAAAESLNGAARRSQTTFRDADEARKAAERAGALARELAAYGGRAPAEMLPVALNEIVEDMLSALRQMLGPRIQLEADLSPQLRTAVADPAQIRQILLKLAANSGEAMEHGGKLRMRTRNAPPDDPALAAGAHTDHVILEISDEGPGMDDASWEHLYEPFFTTKQTGKRGLGLAAVHGIVHQMSGRLWADSQPGKGTAFRIYLPATNATPAPVPAEPPAPVAMPHRPQPVAAPAEPLKPAEPATILLIERNAGLRSVVASVLKKRGYRVLVALEAVEAIDLARKEGLPDLLISDPAPELAARLSALQPHLRTLYLNGHSGSAPGGAVLGKPFELDVFLGEVTQLVAAARAH